MSIIQKKILQCNNKMKQFLKIFKMIINNQKKIMQINKIQKIKKNIIK